MRLEGLKGGVFKRGNVWWIHYSTGEQLPGKTSKGGKPRYKQIRQAIGDRKTAITTLQKKNVEVAEGKHLDKKPTVLFEDLAEEYLREHSSQIRSGYKDENNMKSLKEAFDGKYLNRIMKQDVEHFKISGSDSPVSTNRRLALLKSVFNHAISNKKLTGNPCTGVKFYKETPRLRFLEEDEIETLLTTCTDERLKVALIIALDTGLRKTELFSLKWCNVDFKRGLLHIVITKNGEARYTPMTQRVKNTLSDLPRHATSEYLFYLPDGKRLRDLRKPFDFLLKSCKIRNFHWHDLRHTFASNLVMKGVDLYIVGHLLGQKDPKTALIYAHLSPSFLKNAVEGAEKVSTNLAQSPFQEEMKKHGLL